MDNVIAFPAHRTSPPAAVVDPTRNADILILPVVRIMWGGNPLLPLQPDNPDRLVR